MPDTGAVVPSWISAVGRRIRLLRKRAGWSVQQLADRADVSRRMLTQIELGQANPSLTTVDRIAVALDTDFPGLAMSVTPSGSAAAHITEPARIWEDHDGSEAILLGATSPDSRAELWRWTLARGQTYSSAQNAGGTEAIIHVLSGELTIRDDGNTITVPTAATALFRTSGAYSYINDTSADVHFVRMFRSV
ncbi:MAG: helix-turn-helix domain-containing protein [Rhodoglobus sp.]